MISMERKGASERSKFYEYKEKKPADRVFIHGKKTRATKTVFLNGWKKNVNVSPTRRMAKKKRKRGGENIQKSKLLAIIISLV